MLEEYSSSEDIFTPSNDEGTASAPTVNESSTEVEQPSVDSQTDASENVAEAQDIPEDQSQAQASDDFSALTDDDKHQLGEKYIEHLKSQGVLPKFLQNQVDGIYKPKLAEMTSQLEAWKALEEHGKPEEILGRLSPAKIGDWENNPQTGFPEFTTKKWVENLYQSEPKTLVRLLQDAALMENPEKPGHLLVHGILESAGIDPTRLDEIREFAQNGYQVRTLNSGVHPPPTDDELAEIPSDLHDTFAALSPEERRLYMPRYDDDATDIKVKQDTLRRAKGDMERQASEEAQKATQVEQEKQQAQQLEQQFRQEVFEQASANFQQSGDRILTSFTESLVKQSGLSELESFNLTNTLLTAIDGRGAAGQKTLAALENAGIKLDPSIAPLMAELEQANQRASYFAHQRVNNSAEKAAAVNRVAELEQKLVLKGNPIIAQVVQYVAKQKVEGIKKESEKLTQAQQMNGINSNGHQAKIGTGSMAGVDYSTLEANDIFI